MKNILVIEDDNNVRENLQQLLQRVGFSVLQAENGTEGIELARNNIPDLIICDIMMPELNGYDVINILSKDAETSTIPFIFLSAKAEPADFREGMKLGADDYLTKPYSVSDLLNAINSRLAKREKLVQGLEKKLTNENSQPPNDEKTDHIFVNKGGKVKILKLDEISHILVEDVYTAVFSIQQEKFLIRKPLKNWCEFLPNIKFIRIHQSIIVNIDRIQKIEEWFNGTYKVYLAELDEAFISSRRYGVKLRNIIKKTF
jgi:DNA-binding LytR/AlgR family response regulator